MILFGHFVDQLVGNLGMCQTSFLNKSLQTVWMIEIHTDSHALATEKDDQHQ